MPFGLTLTQDMKVERFTVLLHPNIVFSTMQFLQGGKYISNLIN